MMLLFKILIVLGAIMAFLITAGLILAMIMWRDK